MRASKENRGHGPLSPEEQSSANSQTPGRAKSRRRIWLISLAALVLVVGGSLALWATGFFANRTTAVTVGDYRLSPAQFTYFYWDAFYDYFNANQGDISQIDDARNTMKSAMYNEEAGITMTEHFTEVALADAATVYSVYDAALADGYVLTEADQSYLKNQRAMLDVYVYSLGLQDAEAYVRQFYSRDCTLDGYLAYLEMRKIASGYADAKKLAFSYTPQQLDAAYAASPLDFESVSYKVYYVSHSTGENADGTAKVDMALSEQAATQMATACQNDIARFDEMAVELAPEKKKNTYKDPNFSLRTDDIVGQATEPLRDWLADPARQYGDTTYVQADESGYYVGFFIGYNDNDYLLPRIRAAQIVAASDQDRADDPDGMKQATATAQSILDRYAAGPQTAEGFDQAAQAEQAQSEHVSTLVQSPLLPTAAPAELRQWCFDPARQPGDTLLQPAQGGCYVLYFDGYADRTYRDHLVDTQLRDADYKAWYEGVSTALTAQPRGFGMFFVRT